MRLRITPSTVSRVSALLVLAVLLVSPPAVHSQQNVPRAPQAQDSRTIDDYMSGCRQWLSRLSSYEDEVIADCTKVIELKPGSYEAYRRRAAAWGMKYDTEHEAADLATTIALTTQAIALNPQDYETYEQRALAWSGPDRDDRRLADLRQAIDLSPRDVDGYYNRADLHRMTGEPEAALADLNHALELLTTAIALNPASYEAYADRAVAWWKKDETAEMIADYAKAIDLIVPVDAAGYYRRAQLESKINSGEAALADLTRAIALNPRYYEAYQLRVSMWDETDYESQVADTETLLSLKPRPLTRQDYSNRVSLYERRGEQRLALGNRTGAQSDFLEAERFSELAGECFREQVDRAFPIASQIRQLAIVRPVRLLQFSRRQEARIYIEQLTTRYIRPKEQHALEQTYRRLGLIPVDFNVIDAMVRYVTYIPRGSYDQYMNAVEFPTTGEGLWDTSVRHELTHALQDQHFDYDAIDSRTRSNYDRRWAIYSLEEGDAQWVGDHELADVPEIKPSPGARSRTVISPAAGPSAALGRSRSPAWIGDLFRLGASAHEGKPFADLKLFMGGSDISDYPSEYPSLDPDYGAGEAFVDAVLQQQGWAGVNRAYEELSSEQLLHPAKYLAGEAPVEVSVPDVSSFFEKGWTLIRENVVGEWGYFHVLRQYVDGEVAKAGSEGWGGDSYAVYEGPHAGDVCIIQVTTWDTEVDAREFFAAYEARTLKRYPSAKAIKGASPTKPDVRAWRTNEGGVAMERRGMSVLIVEGIPERAGSTPRRR